jgi:hypothetical protein
LRRIATIESIGSSTRIEGNKLSDREVEHLLGKLEIKTLRDSRDEQEVAGYAEAMETIFHSLGRIFPSPRTISNSFTAIFCATVRRMSGTGANIKPCAMMWALLTQTEK